jgi:hypothetical protein
MNVLIFCHIEIFVRDLIAAKIEKNIAKYLLAIKIKNKMRPRFY